MKTLILLRHAKASWDNVSLDDFDRPLNKHGIEDTVVMGRWIGANDLWPDLALCSDAIRTQASWAGLLKQGAGDIPTELRPELYLAKPADLMRAITTAPNEAARLCVIGHNPGLSMVANELCIPSLLNKLKKIGGFPPLTYAEFEFTIDNWRDIRPQAGALTRVESPKTIGKEARTQ